MVGEMWYGEREKESREDMFLVLFAENSSRMGRKHNANL